MSVGKHSRSCNDIISCLLALAFWSWSFTWIICVIFCFYDEKYLFWGRKVDNKSNWVLSSSIIWWKTHKACFEGLGESGRSWGTDDEWVWEELRRHYISRIIQLGIVQGRLEPHISICFFSSHFLTLTEILVDDWLMTSVIYMFVEKYIKHFT